MSKPISFGKLEFEIVASMEETRRALEPETPFRILIMGDFSGRVNRGIFDPGTALSAGRLIGVDRDNIEEIPGRLGAEIQLRIAGYKGPKITLRFHELDDLHPDNIYEQVEIFQALRETRDLLKDPQTFAAAADRIGSRSRTETKAKPTGQPSEKTVATPKPPELPAGNLLDQVITASEGQKAETPSSPDTSEWGAFLQDIVSPHLVPDIEPKQTEMIASVDKAVSELMCTILHNPDFQAIEATWRGIHFLTRRLETDARLKLYLLDISKPELAADLTATEDLRSTETYKLLVEQSDETPGSEPWALLTGNYLFDQTRDDAELLGKLANIAKQAGAPFVSSVGPRMLGCESLAQTPDPDDWQPSTDTESPSAWQELRKLPAAAYLGLAIPRFLLRLPYGADTDPVDNFDFEEFPNGPTHEHYLWGNPCFACVCLLGEAFSRYEWDLRPGVIRDIDGLPLHVYEEQGESRIKPCAEVQLTERAAERILDKGFMPLLSFRSQDKIRMARIQSVTLPPTSLAGRWGFKE